MIQWIDTFQSSNTSESLARRSLDADLQAETVGFEVKRGPGTEKLLKRMTLRHLLMHTSGIGYGPGAITPGVALVARSPEDSSPKHGWCKPWL